MLFKVIIKPDLENGDFNISCPALPGCHSQGDTEEEAIGNIKDAIMGCPLVPFGPFYVWPQNCHCQG